MSLKLRYRRAEAELRRLAAEIVVAALSPDDGEAE